jgi:hypothetical protein
VAPRSMKLKILFVAEIIVLVGAIVSTVLALFGRGIHLEICTARGRSPIHCEMNHASALSFGALFGEGPSTSATHFEIRPLFGIGGGSSGVPRGAWGFGVYASCWFSGLVLLGLGITFHLMRGRSRKKLKEGCCPTCGYDLRAHKPGQKCPECGTEIPRFGWRSSKNGRGGG